MISIRTKHLQEDTFKNNLQLYILHLDFILQLLLYTLQSGLYISQMKLYFSQCELISQRSQFVSNGEFMS